MKKYKIVCILLVFYTLIGGLLLPVPRQAILNETVRNLYYHVTMWFTMFFLLSLSVYHSISYLRTKALYHDQKAYSFASVGIVFGVIGILTGSLWANFTWGAWWTNDPKLNGSAITMLIYLAYMILRNSLQEIERKAVISAVYSIFAFSAMVVLLFVLPRTTDSLHPGNGGNPGFKIYDSDHQMKWVFYPAIVGWCLLGYWISEIIYQIQLLSQSRMK